MAGGWGEVGTGKREAETETSTETRTFSVAATIWDTSHPRSPSVKEQPAQSPQRHPSHPAETYNQFNPKGEDSNHGNDTCLCLSQSSKFHILQKAKG